MVSRTDIKRRVLMVSPHFPPDTSAGTHRVRLLAPHLSACGWEPTIVSVDPRDYESRLDPGLADLVPENLRLVRCRAWSPKWTRKIAVGDLGLRAFSGLRHTCRQLLRSERFDALFITMYPSYPALLGPSLKRRFDIPFVLDYQDPWVGAWGKDVGARPDGKPDAKSRLTRLLASWLEPRVVKHVDAITAVSQGTFREIQERCPETRDVPCEAIPLGGEASDFDALRKNPRPNGFFDPDDGNVHICYVGTLLPLGFQTLRGFLLATRRLREESPDLYGRLRLNFFGTSNQTAADAPQRVLPLARETGVDDILTEHAPRIDYLDALAVQTQASVVLMLGSSERHYTASKLYPGLLARRPILALYHRESSVASILPRVASNPTGRLVTYDSNQNAQAIAEATYPALCACVQDPQYRATDVNLDGMNEFSAGALAAKLTGVFNQVCEQHCC